jgi:hypothetical protein
LILSFIHKKAAFDSHGWNGFNTDGERE